MLYSLNDKNNAEIESSLTAKRIGIFLFCMNFLRDNQPDFMMIDDNIRSYLINSSLCDSSKRPLDNLYEFLNQNTEDVIFSGMSNFYGLDVIKFPAKCFFFNLKKLKELLSRYNISVASLFPKLTKEQAFLPLEDYFMIFSLALLQSLREDMSGVFKKLPKDDLSYIRSCENRNVNDGNLAEGENESSEGQDKSKRNFGFANEWIKISFDESSKNDDNNMKLYKAVLEKMQKMVAANILRVTNKNLLGKDNTYNIAKLDASLKNTGFKDGELILEKLFGEMWPHQKKITAVIKENWQKHISNVNKSIDYEGRGMEEENNLMEEKNNLMEEENICLENIQSYSIENRILIESPTGTGKTLVQLYLALYCLVSQDKSCFIVTPTRDLVRQIYDYCCGKYSDILIKLGLEAYTPPFHMIMSDLCTLNSYRFTEEGIEVLIKSRRIFIICQQSFENILKMFRGKIKNLPIIYDESHITAENTLHSLFPSVEFTATTNPKKRSRIDVQYTTEEAIAKGIIPKVEEITFIFEPATLDTATKPSKAKLKSKKSQLKENEKAKLPTFEEILNSHSNIKAMIVCGNVDILKNMENIIKNVNKERKDDEISIFILHTNSDLKNKLNVFNSLGEIYNSIKSSPNFIILVQNMLQIGVNIPELNCLVLAKEEVSGTNYKQIIGRLHRCSNMRENDCKTICVCEKTIYIPEELKIS